MSEVNGQQGLMDKLAALAKRRGFIFQGSEIYGGINGFWDYGPLGVELKRNVKEAWWHDMVTTRDDMVGLDCAIIMNPRVWEASGHLAGFADPMQTCRQCKKLFRADQVEDMLRETEWYTQLKEIWSSKDPVDLEALRKWAGKQGKKLAPSLGLVRDTDAVIAALTRVLSQTTHLEPRPDAFSNLLFDAGGQQFMTDTCPNCGSHLMEPRNFNLMFKTYVGAMEDASSVAYLRPETAQGIFANFKNVLDTSRVKLPFGIAQVGKSFRNEINPRNYTFRSREFEQMEIEFFCAPGDAPRWYEYWRDLRHQWYVSIGLRSSRLRLREHGREELAHYAAACADLEYEFPFGISELEGIANRTDYDLRRHQEFSGKDLTYFDEEARQRYWPYVIEPSAGVDRTVLALLCEAYDEDEVEGEKRVLLRFHPRIAPIKAAVFPLVKRDGMPEVARAIHKDLKSCFTAFYDEKGAIGRRYRRQDEAGTPFCITVDGQTAQDGTVTIRDRDSLQQVRIDKSRCAAYVRDKLGLSHG